MPNNRFDEDILEIVRRAISKYGDGVRGKVTELGNKLIELHKNNRVKINHSVMEIVVGAYLASKGYDVDVEAEVGGNLVADVVAWRGNKKMIVEIETGFTSPENALDPQRYLKARVVSKLARYSKHADTFSFATPLHNILQIPLYYLRPVEKRRKRETEALKELCDMYYSQPPITVEDIRASKIESIYLLNVDTLDVLKLTPEKYVRTTIQKLLSTDPAI